MKPLIYLGFVKKTHGFKGAVKISIENIQAKFNQTEPLMLEINKKAVPFFIEQISKTDTEWQVKFEYINSVEEAEEITGLSVYFESDDASDEDVWVHEAIGYHLIDSKLGEIGTVTDVVTKPGQDLLEITLKDKIFFIPYVKELIQKFDHKKEIIYTDLPEGLIDIND